MRTSTLFSGLPGLVLALAIPFTSLNASHLSMSLACDAEFEFEINGLEVHFINQSTSDGEIVSYLWDFGDGHESDDENPTHLYEEPGAYLVCLTIEDNQGCTDEQCHDFLLELGECNADFEFEINGLEVHFINLSTSDGEIVSYLWDFGDGHESDDENPTHLYEEPGAYLVCLTIEDNQGCTDEQCHDFLLELGECNADFEFEINGLEVHFINLSTSDGEIVSYLWDFGDGHGSSDENPTHLYEEPGAYLVCLTIEDNQGCTDEQCHDFVLELGECNAAFEFEINGLEVHFINQSTSSGEIVSYLWDFGDGHESDDENPTHLYEEPGVYLVCLTIEDNQGCTDEQCHDFVLELGECNAAFEFEINGLEVHFINQSTSSGEIVSYLWDFGDGHESDDENPTHLYEEPGVYLVCLTIEDNQGCTDEQCHDFVLELGECNAAFEFEINGLEVHFINQSTSSGEIVSYLWDFGDGHESDDENPTHLYEEPGVYLVCLTIEDNQGCTDEQCHDFVLELEECNAAFEFEINGLEVHFINQSTSSGEIVSYLWDFGDGHVSDDENPTHLYEEPGVYLVCLTIEDNQGCTDEQCHDFVLELEECNAAFEFEINGLEVHFINQSTSSGEIVSYLWDFGDGHESDDENPTHLYEEPGVYLVCLTIEDNQGCTDEQCHDFVLELEECNAAFEFEINGLEVHFINQSTSNGEIVSYLWDFGDGHESDDENPTHLYEESGAYLVCLTIEDNQGCTDEQCHDFVLELEECNAEFEWEDDELEVHFVNQSTSNGEIVSYLWDFGDGHESDDENPTHVYEEPGVYVVCLIIVDDEGCAADVCHEVAVGMEDLQCESEFDSYQSVKHPLTVDFVDESKSEGTIGSWYWNFGDEHTSEVQNPSHTYQKAGEYIVCLEVTDVDLGCTHTTCHIMTVVPNVEYEGVDKADQGVSGSPFQPLIGAEDSESIDDVRIYPNPLKDNTTLEYELLTDTHVRVELFDDLGQPVRMPVTEYQPKGVHMMPLDLDLVPPGSYRLRIVAGNHIVTKRISIID